MHSRAIQYLFGLAKAKTLTRRIRPPGKKKTPVKDSSGKAWVGKIFEAHNSWPEERKDEEGKVS